MSVHLRRAEKKQYKAKVAIAGGPGCGERYSSLNVAKYLVPGGKTLLVDTEQGSSEKYADEFDFDIGASEVLDRFTYRIYRVRRENGYDVLIVDSMSHYWSGTDE